MNTRIDKSDLSIDSSIYELVESEILPGTGHMIMVERPNETIDAIDGFLKQVRA